MLHTLEYHVFLSGLSFVDHGEKGSGANTGEGRVARDIAHIEA